MANNKSTLIDVKNTPEQESFEFSQSLRLWTFVLFASSTVVVAYQQRFICGLLLLVFHMFFSFKSDARSGLLCRLLSFQNEGAFEWESCYCFRAMVFALSALSRRMSTICYLGLLTTLKYWTTFVRYHVRARILFCVFLRQTPNETPSESFPNPPMSHSACF